MIWDVIVIGGGASGLMAAGQAGSQGGQVLLLEKNDQMGKKVRISGKGRCNITNAGDFDDFLTNFPGNGRFLTGAYHRFGPRELIAFLEEQGVPTKVERGNRVFPISDDANQVADALVRWVQDQNVRIERRVVVDTVTKTRDDAFRVSGANGSWIGRTVILATGGASYPGTGSTGDGWLLARRFGHDIVKPQPSLVPLRTKEQWPATVSGLSLRNVTVRIEAWTKGDETDPKKREGIAEGFGEMLFTHFGVSGPTVLTLSRSAGLWLQEGLDVHLLIDLKPALNREKLDQRVLRDFETYSRKQLKNGMVDLLPKALIPIVLEQAQVDPEKDIHQVTKEERESLVTALKGLSLRIQDCLPMAAAIVTRGGVAVQEVSPKTMESKIVPGLFFAGELMDIDGFTGGFNLQAAFSTGWIAGEAALQKSWTS